MRRCSRIANISDQINLIILSFHTHTSSKCLFKYIFTLKGFLNLNGNYFFFLLFDGHSRDRQKRGERGNDMQDTASDAGLGTSIKKGVTQDSSVTGSTIAPHVNYLEPVTGIDHGQKNDGICPFIIKKLRESQSLGRGAFSTTCLPSRAPQHRGKVHRSSYWTLRMDLLSVDGTAMKSQIALTTAGTMENRIDNSSGFNFL